ncbi:MAG: FecR family protein [Bacteroidota bacterium]|nr:FecR family protein [Bacteroidota bacterium]
MKHRTFIKSSLLVIASLLIINLFSGYTSDNPSLAVMTKVIQDVKKKMEAADWTKADKGDMLYNGNQVRTAKKSLAILKFKDNSIVRLREESELTIHGEGQRGTMTKQAHLYKGSLGFDVQKQGNEKFRLSSPTSVASIRGTKGKWSSGNGYDTLVVTEGLVNLRNLVSNNEVDVGAGFVGFSDETGSVTSREATEQELNQAANAAIGGTLNELKLELQDPEGNKKELKLRYKQ